MLQHKIKKPAIMFSWMITALLLNSCQVKNQALHMMDQEQKYLDKSPNQHPLHVDLDEFCPNCQEGSRYLYKLATGDGEIIVICEECTSVWIDPDNLGWGETISDQLLEERFHVEDVDVLFDETKGANWATREDIKGSRWQGKTNGILFKNE